MKYKSIIFREHEIRDILSVRKTQTRSVAKVTNDAYVKQGGLAYYSPIQNQEVKKIPRYAVGDIIYVRETWYPESYPEFHYVCKASTPDPDNYPTYNCDRKGWRSPCYMPRDAARIFLEVTAVRAERLNSIGPKDAWAEGFEHIFAFEQIWDSKYGKKPGCAWADNPWVFVYTFKRVEKPEGLK